MAELGTRIPKYILARDAKAIETFSTYLISSAHTAVDFVALQTDKVHPMVLKSLSGLCPTQSRGSPKGS